MKPQSGGFISFYAALLICIVFSVACDSSSDREQSLEATVEALTARIQSSEAQMNEDLTAAPVSDPELEASSNSADESTDPAEILLNQYMAESEKPFSGVVLVDLDGKTIFKEAFGLADRELQVPNTPDTKFAIGSLTKSFTAAAIMLYQQRNKLSVDDSLCENISDCPDIWQPITIGHLLTHGSELKD